RGSRPASYVSPSSVFAVAGPPAGPGAGDDAGRHGEAAISPRAARVPAEVVPAGPASCWGRVEVARTIGAISLTETEYPRLTTVTLGGLWKASRGLVRGRVKGRAAVFPGLGGGVSPAPGARSRRLNRPRANLNRQAGSGPDRRPPEARMRGSEPGGQPAALGDGALGIQFGGHVGTANQVHRRGDPCLLQLRVQVAARLLARAYDHRIH